jgi:[CysO sulfur-carrier protein]-S-L-cysteine hydrolase
MGGGSGLEVARVGHPRDQTRLQNQLGMIELLGLSATQLEQMRDHVQACAPLEACGLLLGRAQVVARVVPVENAARSRSRFRMEPAAQLSAFRSMEEHGLDLLGIFHSHPAEAMNETAALEGPSETDIREAAYPVVHVIWSRRLGKWQARGFWIEEGRISEVRLLVSPAEEQQALMGS